MNAKHRALEPPARPRDRVLVGAVAAVLLVLALVADDRHVGLVADGRQMIRTAIAIAETGQLGQVAGRDFALLRDEGDAASIVAPGSAAPEGSLTTTSSAPVVWAFAAGTPTRYTRL